MLAVFGTLTYPIKLLFHFHDYVLSVTTTTSGFFTPSFEEFLVKGNFQKKRGFCSSKFQHFYYIVPKDIALKKCSEKDEILVMALLNKHSFFIKGCTTALKFVSSVDEENKNKTITKSIDLNNFTKLFIFFLSFILSIGIIGTGFSSWNTIVIAIGFIMLYAIPYLIRVMFKKSDIKKIKKLIVKYNSSDNK